MTQKPTIENLGTQWCPDGTRGDGTPTVRHSSVSVYLSEASFSVSLFLRPLYLSSLCTHFLGRTYTWWFRVGGIDDGVTGVCLTGPFGET